MKEARFYTKGEESYVYCILCPHLCKIPNGKLGKCRGRKNIDGKLYSLNYGRITSYAFDPIEKKPLYHFYPGSEIFSLGSFGCNLACDFCQNWEIVYEDNVALSVKIDDIIELAKAQDGVGIAYTYNEPTIYYEFVYDIAKKAKDEGMKNVLITNGYINSDPLNELLPYIDAMNINLKSISESFYKYHCKGSLGPVLSAIELCAKKTHVEITTLVIDGENSTLNELDMLAKRISMINKNIPLHLSRYFPNFKLKLPPTKTETLLEARSIAQKYLNYVYIGNLWGIDNNTYCPKCYNKLIDRHNGGKIVGLDDKKCDRCDLKINIKY